MLLSGLHLTLRPRISRSLCGNGKVFVVKRRCGNSSQLTRASTIQLKDGNVIPVLGLGIYKILAGKDTFNAVLSALDRGYRLVDTAAYYGNEKDVGDAIKRSSLPRSDVFIVTKVWDDMHGYDKTMLSLQNSLRNLDTDFVDMLLIHSPMGGKVVETWKALQDAKCQGLTRSIGVSNFGIHHLTSLDMYSEISPVVNQIEVHPFLQEKELVQFCINKDIKIMTYSPLAKGKILDDPIVCQIAEKYRKSSAQILIRWSIQNGFICIPKSVHSDRIAENVQVFDFELDDEDMMKLSALEANFRTGGDKVRREWLPF